VTTSAEEGAIAEVGSPVLLPPDPADTHAPWRWTTGVIAAATLLLGVLNAHAIGEWFDELTPGPVSEPLRAPVGYWTGATAARGLDAPRAALRRGWEGVRAARFGKEQPGEQGAADAQ
jgi:hypothetical protein